MAKPSIYAQITATQVRGEHMMPSPRHWNNGLFRYKGRLWCCYRFHLGREHASRSATALVPISKETLQPIAPSQHLNLPGKNGDEHFEDARMFVFNGQPHVSFTVMTGYSPGVDFRCVLQYARLKLNGNRWLIEEVFQPSYGQNHGYAKEKNWTFFESDGALFAIYQDALERIIIEIEGDKVVREHKSAPATWPWGPMRGGSQPVLLPNGQFLVMFHSSLPTEESPHYVRYYGAAYTFENKPPFRITSISQQPLMAGSEADGHGVDPRYSAGWKPYVVFPAGLVPPVEGSEDQSFLVSLGVNDWQCAVGRIRLDQMHLGAPDRSDAPMRYFATNNGSMPAKMTDPNGNSAWIYWEIIEGNRIGGSVAPGLYATRDGREAEAMCDAPGAQEITAEEYHRRGGRMAIPARGETRSFAEQTV